MKRSVSTRRTWTRSPTTGTFAASHSRSGRAIPTNTHRYDPSLWWLVEDGDELAAISLNGWDFSGDPQFGWIQVLGVRPRWRKRGLGTALLLHSFRDFRDRGATRVGLGVDGESTTGAVRLYESVGMRQVRRNVTYEKTL